MSCTGIPASDVQRAKAFTRNKFIFWTRRTLFICLLLVGVISNLRSVHQTCTANTPCKKCEHRQYHHRNCKCSFVCTQPAEIHLTISDENLDIVAINKTWLPLDDTLDGSPILMGAIWMVVVVVAVIFKDNLKVADKLRDLHI